MSTPLRLAPSPAQWRHWLQAPGSLSRRVAALGSRFEVQPQFQGVARPTKAERRDLNLPPGHSCWVREVLLCLDGQALVWARSSLPLQARRGPWRALRGLGSRALAELLFQDRTVRRSPLHRETLPPHNPLRAKLAQAWGTPPPHAVRGRASVFVRRGSALRVMEALSPALVSAAPNPAPHRQTPSAPASDSGERL